MLRDFLWEAFKSTGSIEAYIFYKEIETNNDSEDDDTEDGILSETLEIVR